MSSETIKILFKAGIGLFCLMAFTMFAINASAATYEPIEQCWQKPTERESGAVLALEDIIGYEIWYDEENDDIHWQLEWEVSNTVGCVTYTPLGAGKVCFNGFTVAVNNIDASLPPLKSKVSNMTCHMPVEIPVLEDPPKAPAMIAEKIAEIVDLLEDLAALISVEYNRNSI